MCARRPSRRDDKVVDVQLRLSRRPLPDHDGSQVEQEDAKFSRGERFVNEPIDRAEFDELMAQVVRWGLDDVLEKREFDDIAYNVA